MRAKWIMQLGNPVIFHVWHLAPLSIGAYTLTTGRKSERVRVRERETEREREREREYAYHFFTSLPCTVFLLHLCTHSSVSPLVHTVSSSGPYLTGGDEPGCGEGEINNSQHHCHTTTAPNINLGSVDNHTVRGGIDHVISVRLSREKQTTRQKLITGTAGVCTTTAHLLPGLPLPPIYTSDRVSIPKAYCMCK